jgi:hypothetical protein
MQVVKYGIPMSLAFLGMVAWACYEEIPNLNHCWQAEGDATCRTQSPDRPYCSYEQPPCNVAANLGCVADIPALDQCYSPCGGGLSILDDASCLGSGEETGSSESGSEGSEVSDVDSSDSETEGDDCSACADPLVCDTGECVECTMGEQQSCIAMKQWCDPITNSCQACTDHFQCPGQAGCHILEGTCLPPNRVFQVHSDWGLSLDEAIEMLGSDDGTILIHESSTSMLGSTLNLADDQVVAIVSPGGVWPTIERVDSESDIEDFTFTVGTGHLYLWGVNLRGEAGVRIHGSKLGEHGTVHVERTSFNNQMSAISMVGGKGWLRNVGLVSANLDNAVTLHLRGYSDLNITFSTILAISGDLALRCDPIARSSSALTVRNSIMGSIDDKNGLDLQNDCDYQISNSAHEPTVFPLQGSDNKQIEALTPGDFVDLANGDIHLINPNKFAGIADWFDNDPRVDIDGEMREVDVLTWPGADHP